MIQKCQTEGFREWRLGFTLIELLVVVAIIGIMLVISLPAFESFTRRSLSTAVPELASTLRLARQYAVTHRQPVFVVFPDNSVTDYSSSKAHVGKALHAYAVITTNASGVIYLTDWKFLSEGIYFDAGLSVVVTNGASVFKSYGSGAQTTFPFPHENAMASVNMPAILFKPNGRAYSCSGSSWSDFGTTQIGITEAVADVNTNAGTVNIVPVGTTNVVVRVRNRTGQLDFVGL